MAETVVDFQTPVVGSDGVTYAARAVAGEVPGGNWQGWIEFTPVGGGETLCSPRETTQPKRSDVVYWATGLTGVYLEGALARASAKPIRSAAPPPLTTPRFETPADRSAPVPSDQPVGSVLDPFAVYSKGEELLRRQLAALSAWHLVNIIVDYGLSDDSRAALSRASEPALIEMIVREVQNQSVGPRDRLAH